MYLKMLRIGITFQGFCNWQGGIDFCMNFVRVLKQEKLRVYCFIPLSLNKNELKQRLLLGYEIKNNNPNARIVFYINRGLGELVQKYSIQILFPIFESKNSVKIPCIGYIADLQHKYLIGNFSKQDTQARDKEYRAILNKYKYVLVNSLSVKNDIEKFYSPYKANIIVLPCISIASKYHIENRKPFNMLQKKYQLPKRYFMISNQFWVHKNHLLAFKAFEEFYDKGNKDVYLVCTGKMEDYRNTKYITELLNEKDALSCKDNILLLGLISKPEQLGIMRNAIALIQPTRFEGGPGGGAVYDAMAMQVPCIVSNIEINRELPKSKRIYYFNAEDAGDLVQKMYNVIKDKHKRKTDRVLQKMKEENIRRYRQIMLEIARGVINGEQIGGK